MVESFGARLRAERERRQIALSAIAADTKIKASLFEGLERDDISYWPEGIFRRAYVRAYARAVGLDAEATVREFLAAYPEPAEEVDPVRAIAASKGGGIASLLRGPRRRRAAMGGDGAAPAPALDSPEPTPADVHVPQPEPAGALGLMDDAVAVTHVVDHGTAASADAAADEPVAAPEPAPPPPRPSPAPCLVGTSELCTRLALLRDTGGLAPLLDDAVRVLGAVGLIVWVWDPRVSALRATFAAGYPPELVARCPAVSVDDANAVAAAFRSQQASLVTGDGSATGAVTVPMMTASGCIGVFALELCDGGEQQEPVRACATIMAAQLAAFVEVLVPAATAVA